jgi:hypothetical protein
MSNDQLARHAGEEFVASSRCRDKAGQKQHRRLANAYVDELEKRRMKLPRRIMGKDRTGPVRVN